MDQLISCQSLPKSALIPSASWDLHPFLSDTSPTFQTSDSIGRIGLLYVPIVRSISNETYEFITGKRCVNSLHDHSSGNEIFCRVLSKDLPVKQLLAILYEEHLAFGKLSPIELAYFLELCRTHLAKVDESSLYTSLGLPEKQHFANRLLELISLELPLQHGLMEGTITESLARDLLRIHKADRLATYSLFTQLKLGGGKQKRLFSLLRDLSGRSGISIDQYMQQAPLQDIIDHPEMNTPQKAQSLMQYLQLQHSPALRDAENSFKNWQKELSLPPNCSVQHSQAFEQDTVTLSVQFNNKDRFENCWPRIKAFLPTEES